MRLISLLFFLFSSLLLFSQSSFFLQNNTDLDLQIDVIQKGSLVLPEAFWADNITNLEYWSNKEEVLEVRRDTVFQPGDTVVFEVLVSVNNDTIWLEMLLIETANENKHFYSARGDGFDYTWLNASFFREAAVTIGGIDCTFKLKPENGDGSDSRDVFFIIHQNELYSIDEADFYNPNVLHVMSYNIKLLPLAASDFYERASLFPNHISPYQDVVIFQEVFDTATLNNVLIPTMEAKGFVYNSGILNSVLLPHITTPTSGGVITFSKWPIVKTAEYDYVSCAPAAADCFASKGIKYALIDKIGVNYHVFGTHMEAGGDSADIIVKRTQFGEMRDFVSAQQIPVGEAVLMGGDFNNSPFSSDNLYQALIDSLNPIKTDHYGYPNSTFSSFPGKVIDHVYAHNEYLLPLNANNGIITVRGIDSIMWSISEFSDHRTIISRFEYPGSKLAPNARVICPDTPVNIELNFDNTINYTWYKNGNLLNFSGLNYTIPVPSINDEGVYTVDLDYSFTVGTGSDVVTQAFFPNGPKTFSGTFTVQVADLTYADVCPVGITESNILRDVEVYPTLTNNVLYIDNIPENTELEINVYNTTGQKVLDYYIGSVKAEIDVSSLNKGIYFLELTSNNAKAIKHFYKGY